MAKTREKWETIWNNTTYKENPGTPIQVEDNISVMKNPFANNPTTDAHFVKSLELLRQYCGYTGENGGGIAGKIVSFRWGSKYCLEVQNAIRPFMKNDGKEPKTPQALLNRVTASLTASPKVDCDLDIIIKLITNKSGAHFTRPEEKLGLIYGDNLLTDDDVTTKIKKHKANE